MYITCSAYAERILSHTEHTRNEFHRMLSIRGTDFIACWACSEMFKSRISRPNRIRFSKISCYRPLGPYGFGFCKKSQKKISCLCTFNSGLWIPRFGLRGKLLRIPSFTSKKRKPLLSSKKILVGKKNNDMVKIRKRLTFYFILTGYLDLDWPKLCTDSKYLIWHSETIEINETLKHKIIKHE